jgi:hypothetical protein
MATIPRLQSALSIERPRQERQPYPGQQFVSRSGQNIPALLIAVCKMNGSLREAPVRHATEVMGDEDTNEYEREQRETNHPVLVRARTIPDGKVADHWVLGLPSCLGLRSIPARSMFEQSRRRLKFLLRSPSPFG